MRDYARIATKIQETPWMITAEGLRVVLGIFNEHRSGVKLSQEEIEIRLNAARMVNGGRTGEPDGPEIINGVGILPLMGPIFGKANLMTQMSGATSLAAWRQELRTLLNDDRAHSILMQIDSPGGSSEMVNEVADEIFAARQIKPIYAVADSLSASAAYYLGSQANALYATPSGSVGSIGVYSVHEDQSGKDAQDGIKYTYVFAGPHKVDGNPHEPLAPDARAHMQEVVNEVYDEFVGAVARGRGISEDQVRADYGGGKVFTAKKALEVGMIDGIVPFEKLVNQISANKPRQLRQVQMPAAAAIEFANSILASSSTYTDKYVTLDFDTNTTNVGKLDGFVVLPRAESKEWEHSEPGTGSPPQPRRDQDGSDDSAIKSGSRRDPLPLDKDAPGAPQANSQNSEHGGEDMDTDTLAKLNQLFGLSADTDEATLLAKASAQVNELNEFKAATNVASEQQRLAAEFPVMWEQHQKMLSETRATKATAFVNEVSRIKNVGKDGNKVDSEFGLSALAMETIADAHQKAAVGDCSVEDFENAIKAITDGGTVHFGEQGSSVEPEIRAIDTSSAQGIAKARQMFAEKVAEIKVNDEVDHKTAIKMAAERFPDLAEAYSMAAVA